MVLNKLAEENIKAVFFVIGRKVTDHHELVMRMVKEGHLVENHSYAHSGVFDLWGSKQMRKDIVKASEIIALATGRKPEWFRPPFGVTNPTVAAVVGSLELRVMGWSIRSLDTSVKDPGRIWERIRKRWHPGGIILLHDTNERTTEVLDRIIGFAKSNDYRFVRADEMGELRIKN